MGPTTIDPGTAPVPKAMGGGGPTNMDPGSAPTGRPRRPYLYPRRPFYPYSSSSSPLTMALFWAVWIYTLTALCHAGKTDVPSTVLRCRVIEKAPKGTLITSVRPEFLIPSPRDRANLRLKIVGPNRRAFRLQGYDVIVDDDVLRRPAGQNYSIKVQAKSSSSSSTSSSSRGSLLALWVIDIQVVKRNLFAPHFTQDTFTAEVYRGADVGTKVLQVSATDRDAEEYNSHVTYSLRTSPAALFVTDARDGWISTGASLRGARAVIHLQVTAADSGYPVMSNAVGVTIIVRDIGAPTNFSVTTTTLTTCVVCWYHPRDIRAQKYMVTYARSDDPNQLSSHTVLANKDQATCIKFTDLEPLAEYWAEVRALSDGRSGVPSRIWFYTREDACSGNPCGGGRCELTDGSTTPGFRCTCQESVTCTNTTCTNATCLNPDSIKEILHVIRSCRNGGTFYNDSGAGKCECPDGFAGSSCQFRDLCNRDHEVCLHGATCETVSATRFQCHCVGGHFGDTCEHFNPCFLDPCRNSGVCRNLTESQYECTCTHGYFGKNCTHYNPCASFPCQNNAVCRNVTEEYYLCDCLTGYHGHECENYNPCYHDPCLFGGMCNSVDGKYVCECAYGRYGKHCEHMNLCEALLPCGENSIRCRNTSDSSYKCVCKSGWSGMNCSQYDPCFDKPCLHDNKCTKVNDRDYICTCAEPFYGRHCEKVNPCGDNPCQNSGVCLNVSDTNYVCKCNDGYFGNFCEGYNPCIKAICMNGAACVNQSESQYHCACSPEYFGDLCQYYNGCSSEPCKHGQCKSLENGKYECTCDPGYTGKQCNNYDPCRSNPCQYGATCSNTTILDKLCTCMPGYFGTFCEHFEACRSNPCRSGTCTDLPNGKFQCECPEELFGPTCESSDPCAGHPCANQGTCISITGPSFRCICPTGFYGERCHSYNPCVSNPCHSGGTCQHLSNDRYTCQCREGFQGPVCDIEIPCSNQRPCLYDGACIRRTSGTDIQIYCQCRQGYSGKKCEIFDPCSSNPCLNQGRCLRRMDQQGLLHVFECQCQNGFFGEKCEYHTPCLSYLCKNNGTCVRTATGDVCKCPPGFTGEICDRDVNECRTHVCENGGTCVNVAGSFRCMCPVGFVGRDCELPETCPQEVIYTRAGAFNWAAIAHGAEVTHPCPRNSQQVAFRRCSLASDGNLIWTRPDTSECSTEVTSADMAMQALAPYRNGNVTWITADEIVVATELMEDVLSIGLQNTRVAADIFAVIDQILLSAPASLLEYNISARILRVMDELQAGMALDGTIFSLELTTLDLSVKIVSEDERATGVSFTSRPASKQAGSPSMKIPAEVFKIYTSARRAQFTYFRSGKLFRSPHDTGSEEDIGKSHNNEVISAGIGHHRIVDLHDCVLFELSDISVKGDKNRKCVYWHEDDRRWSAAGVTTLHRPADNIQCCSSHLTHFTVKEMSWPFPHDQHMREPFARSSPHDNMVFLVSFCATGLSLLCLFAVLLTYSLFRVLNRENFGQVVLQLCSSMLLSNVCILVGFHKREVDDDVICLVVAILSHYFTLATLLWASMTSQHVYKLLGREVVAKEKCFILKRSLIAWGLPAGVVAIPLGIDMEVYRADTKRCLISPHARMLYCGAYLTPACIITFTNAVLFVLVLKASIRPHYEVKSASVGLVQARGTCVLLAFVGVSWILGYLAERDQAISALNPYVFEYAYFASLTICGVLTLLFYLLLRRDAITAWRNICCRRCHGASNKRRRVAGKASMGATRMSSEGSDYTLVNDPKYSATCSRRGAGGAGAGIGGASSVVAEEEKMLDPCTSIESLSNKGSHRGSHGGSSTTRSHYGGGGGGGSGGRDGHRLSDARCRTPDSNVSLLQRQYLAMGGGSDSLPASPAPHLRHASAACHQVPSSSSSARGASNAHVDSWMQHSKI